MPGRLKTKTQAGTLFPKQAHTAFLEITRRQYGHMAERMKRSKLPPLPFDLEQYRADVLGVMGGKEDGAIQCRYCHRWFTLAEINVDHAKPLSQGGSAGLDNLDYPCAADNDGKGGLTVAQYLDLLRYLDGIHPLARKDILSRLKRANALAAGARRARALAAKLQGFESGKQGTKSKVEFQDELGAF